MISMYLPIIFIAAAILFNIFKILKEYERAVVFRLGRYVGTRGPGLVILVPFIEKMERISTRVITMDIQPQDIITKDNVSLKVNAVIYFRVMNPEKAILEIEDYYFATSQLAQTTLRSVVGQYTLDDLLTNRDKINQTLQDIIDRATEPWGVKITTVEVKHIDLPREMQRAMAKEAEAERERRSKVISAEGELQRADRLKEASNKLAESPSALQLAYLQSLTEITNEGKNTIILPLPLDLVKPFLENK